MIYQCRFTPDGWRQDDWLLARSPRWEACTSWRQEKDHIANIYPDDLDPSEVQMGRDRTGETYLSMLYKKPISGGCSVKTTCMFIDRMAPLIVFSKELTSVHKEHLEVVLYDCGINLWHHFFNDGKPSWKLIGFIDIDLAANTEHQLFAELRRTHHGKFLYMGIDKPMFGTRLADDWPDEYFVGITACEGRNRFYDFVVNDVKPTPVMTERVSD